VGELQKMLESVPPEPPDKKLPILQARNYFQQLIFGTGVPAQLGVICKDIKPGNLLLTLDHSLKISDFGMAEHLDAFSPNDECTTGQGSPAIHPPEIFNGHESFSGYKVDIWVTL
jgi:serine/threonine-protein kinase 11